MTDKEWLSQLKAGDKVMIRRGGPICGNALSLDEVSRVTQTQIVLVNASRRFRRNSGYQLEKPSRFVGRDRLEQVTEESLAELRIGAARSALKSLRVDELSDAQALAMYRAMKDHQS